MKISHRIIAMNAISMAAIAAIVFVLFSSIQTSKINGEKSLDYLMPVNKAILNTKAAFSEVRALVNYNALQDASTIDIVDTAIKNNKDSLNQNLDIFASLAKTSEIRQEIIVIKEQINALFPRWDQAIGLMRSGNNPEAIDILNAEYDRFNLIVKKIDRLEQFLEEQTKVEQREFYQSIQNTVTLSLAVAVIGAGLVVFFGIMTYRRIKSGLAYAEHTLFSVSETLDFSAKIHVDGQDEIANTLNSLNILLDKIKTSMHAIMSDAEAVTKLASEVSTSADEVSKSSQSQSESASNIAAALEEITVSINHVADRVKEASYLANETENRSVHGNEVIKNTVARIEEIAAVVSSTSTDMNNLDNNSREISSVINVIGDVADQTNLLALNAAIEAARAGESGRGFAVVADEVRKLAERTSGSTQQIAGIVNTIQCVSKTTLERMEKTVVKVEQGVADTGQAQTAIVSIAEAAGKSKVITDEICSAITEQSQAANNIAQQVENVAQIAEENFSASIHTSSMSKELRRLSESMHVNLSRYKIA